MSPTLHRFRIDSITRSDPPEDAAFDLDGDGTPDNVASAALRALFQAYEAFDVQALWQAQLDRELAAGIDWRISIETCDDRDGDMRLRVFHAGDPDAAVEAVGVKTGGRVEASGGQGAAPVTALADLADRVTVAGWESTVAVAGDLAFDGVRLEGALGGALVGDYKHRMAEAMLEFFNERARDGDEGWAEEADVDRNGAVSLEELMGSPAFVTLTRPDVDLDVDGFNDAYSFGFLVSATPVDP